MIREFAKKLNIFLLVICIIALQFTIVGAAATYEYPSFHELYSSVSGGSIAVRSEPGIKSNENSVVIEWLSSGEKVKLLGDDKDPDGDLWYLIGFGVGYNEVGYVLPKHITNGKNLGGYTEDKAFEEKLNEQGFPESYKVKLRELHFLYPNWQFVAEKLDMTFAAAVAGERERPEKKVVHPSRDESWRSTDSNVYNAETGKWTKTFDGGWYSASQTVVEYFMDPRNLLDYKTVFVFSPHNYSDVYDTDESLKKILSGTFMSGAFEDDEKKTYFNAIKQAGKDSGVVPSVIASQIIQEQGTDGKGGNVAGDITGFKNLYNYFNIGAYADDELNYNAVQRGLWWAAGAGSGDTSYGRPWDTREKSIKGGAKWYYESYVKVGQNSYYYVNHNVKGEDLFLHEYATNIEDAASKGRIFSKGYTGQKDLQIVFYIPVYKNMPESTSLPSEGSGDNYLKSLVVEGYTDRYSFNTHTPNYEIFVPYEQAKINIKAVANNSSAQISGAGERSLEVGVNEIKITVTAASGANRFYTVSINRNKTPSSEMKNPTLEGSYKTGTYLTGVEPKTSVSDFTTKIGVKNGSIKVFASNDAEKKSGYIGTGDKVKVYNELGTLDKTYTIMILGDADGDGEIKSRDLLIGQRSILKIQALGGVYATAMDIDKDGALKSRDLLIGQRHILKIASIKQ